MPPTLDFESDQKLRLLTDALRAGPGTPQWRAALDEFRPATEAAAPTADEQQEYQLLLRAREDLASGRAYREVRAGPAFTRKIFEQIEREPAANDKIFPTANWIAA